MIAEYVYANVQRIAMMNPDGTIDNYLNDHAGGPAQVPGSARVMVGSGWSANYYPFGEIASQTGSEEHTHFDFTGQGRPHGTGLMYFGTRYYDPSIGRWLSVDPLAHLAPNMTPYHYTHNNPVNRIDPDGRRDDWNTYVSNKEIRKASQHNISISNTKQELITTTEVAPQALDIMSAACNVVAPFSGPVVAPTFFGMGLIFKGSSTVLKVTNQIITKNNNTANIIGDGVGIIVGITHPIAGEIVDVITDVTLDNMTKNLTDDKVDETKKIHKENRTNEILQDELKKKQEE